MAVSPNQASSRSAQARMQQMANFHTPNIPLSQPDGVATTAARYFTPVRYATLEKLAATLVPAANDYPGAVEAGVPEFLDFYIGGSPATEQAAFNAGLDRLNADSMKINHVAFAKADAKQADDAIRPHLKPWMNDHPPREPHQRFIALVHRQIRTATMNSPQYAKAAAAAGERTPGTGLYWNPIDPGTHLWVANGHAQATPTPKQKHS
jgi:hypothetical protein